MICIIIKPVKRIYPSKIFFTINNPLLIIYTPLERPVAPLPVFLFAIIQSHIEMQRSGIEMWL